MHVSPCGWYCFDFPENGEWEIKDGKEKTDIISVDGKCSIELLCARKTTETVDDEISEIHEQYIQQEKILPDRTVLSENPFQVKFYVTKGTGPDEKKWIVGHAYWGQFCVFLQFLGHPSAQINRKIQVFFDILQSLQPLA